MNCPTERDYRCALAVCQHLDDLEREVERWKAVAQFANTWEGHTFRKEYAGKHHIRKPLATFLSDEQYTHLFNDKP